MKEGEKMRDLVLYFVLKYEGKFDEIYNALMKHEEVDENFKKINYLKILIVIMSQYLIMIIQRN